MPPMTMACRRGGIWKVCRTMLSCRSLAGVGTRRSGERRCGERAARCAEGAARLVGGNVSRPMRRGMEPRQGVGEPVNERGKAEPAGAHVR